MKAFDHVIPSGGQIGRVGDDVRTEAARQGCAYGRRLGDIDLNGVKPAPQLDVDQCADRAVAENRHARRLATLHLVTIFQYVSPSSSAAERARSQTRTNF